MRLDRHRCAVGREGPAVPVPVALFVVALFVSPNVLAALAGAPPEAPPAVPAGRVAGSLAVTLLVQLAVFGVALIPLAVTRRLDRRLLGSRSGQVGRLLRAGIVVGVVALVASYAVNAVLVMVLDTAEPVRQQLLVDALRGGVALAVAAVIAVVVAPLTEELVFRGVLFRSLADRFGVGAGVVLSAAVFSLVHLEVLWSQPAALAGLFVIGAVLAAGYHRTGSVLVPVVGHAVFNAVSLSLAFVAQRLA